MSVEVFWHKTGFFFCPTALHPGIPFHVMFLTLNAIIVRQMSGSRHEITNYGEIKNFDSSEKQIKNAKIITLQYKELVAIRTNIHLEGDGVIKTTG